MKKLLLILCAVVVTAQAGAIGIDSDSSAQSWTASNERKVKITAIASGIAVSATPTGTQTVAVASIASGLTVATTQAAVSKTVSTSSTAGGAALAPASPQTKFWGVVLSATDVSPAAAVAIVYDGTDATGTKVLEVRVGTLGDTETVMLPFPRTLATDLFISNASGIVSAVYE